MSRPFRLKACAPDEEAIHLDLVEALRNWAKPNCLWFHCPNGERRDVITGAKLKRMGVRAGAADLMFVHRGRVLFIELKDHKGKQSASQVAFQSIAESAGAEYYVVRSVAHALCILGERGMLIRRLVDGASLSKAEAA